MEKYSLLNWLNDWYIAQCNGEWEHSFGIKIYTYDNPGWGIEIDLESINTNHLPREIDWSIVELERDSINFVSIYNEYEDINFNTWIGIGYEVKNNKYKATCSRFINLEILIFIFKELFENGKIETELILKQFKS